MDRMDTEGIQVEWLTLREAAQRVDRSTKTLRRQVKAGELVGQRSGEGETAPWLISSVSLADFYGEAGISEAAATAALSSGLSDVLTMLADANRAAIRAAAEAARYKTEAEHLRERLNDSKELLRTRAEAHAQAQAQAQAEKAAPVRRRWWRR